MSGIKQAATRLIDFASLIAFQGKFQFAIYALARKTKAMNFRESLKIQKAPFPSGRRLG
jgi:hypothetical protein